MEKVVVIGTGTMAVGIGAGFIQAGIGVSYLGRTRTKADATLAEAEALAKDMSGGTSALSISNAGGVIDEFDDWGDVVWVIETIAEDLALKQKVFGMLDERVPVHIPIGSNSSGFPISRIAEGLATRARMFNAHYFMPAHLVPLVEVALGVDSDPNIGQAVCDFYRRAGKKPVLIRKDIPGFLANRIQHALMREALDLIDRGIASPSDVDTAVRYSFGFRYAAAGPMLQKEISGWDSMARAANEIYPSLSNAQTLAQCARDLIDTGRTGMKAGAGFVAWTPEQAAMERAAYEKRLKAAFQVLLLDDPDREKH